MHAALREALRCLAAERIIFVVFVFHFQFPSLVRRRWRVCVNHTPNPVTVVDRPG
jgi:hypothetical protein